MNKNMDRRTIVSGGKKKKKEQPESPIKSRNRYKIALRTYRVVPRAYTAFIKCFIKG